MAACNTVNMLELNLLEAEEVQSTVEKLSALPKLPVVIEALWDGDTSGWRAEVWAITEEPSQNHFRYKGYFLASFPETGSDWRLPKYQGLKSIGGAKALELTNILSAKFGVSSFFASPHNPEDQCVRWWEQDKGYPCQRCGVLLLQSGECPWRGLCYHCHLDEEREQREAKWTPEQRQGPRCHICGKPATNELNTAPACAECFDKYEVYNCEQCDCPCMISKTSKHSSLCRRCQRQNAVDALTATQRDSIRAAMVKGEFEGIQSAMEIMGCSLYDAEYTVHVLGQSDAT